ncbi:MAG: SDR family oxidoreductase [Spirochaetaceae bacterium]|nr:SDR family oxidoreductase [Spirochaetaceae bacterium]
MDVLQSFSLKGKVALLTGGAGLYGRQLVAALAEAGAETYIASRNTDALEVVASEHRDQGRRVTALFLDQGKEDTIEALKDEIIKRSGRIDILVNNAVARVMSGGMNGSSEAFDESMHINATGVFLMTRIIGRVMEKQKSGSIINIGSMMGMVGVENHNYDGTEMDGWAPDYFFHKGGMINFTRFCASYYGGNNVRVNCISPGGLKHPSHPEQFINNYSNRTQLGRLADDEDLKGTIVYLASDASAYITGINLPVDGGYTAK